MDSLNNYVQKQQGFDTEKAARSYPFYYYAGALYNLYIQWLKNDMQESEEKMAEIAFRIMFPHSKLPYEK